MALLHPAFWPGGRLATPTPTLRLETHVERAVPGPDHRFVLTNPAYQQPIGHRDVIGLTVREAVPEVKSQGFIDLLDSVLSTGEAFVGKNVKIVLQRSADGPEETRYLDFVYQPIKDESGKVTSIFVEGVDITDRHRSEEALRASEARLRQLNADLERQVIERAQARVLTWKLSPDLLGAFNSKGYFETANPAWESVLGHGAPCLTSSRDCRTFDRIASLSASSTTSSSVGLQDRRV